MNKVFHFFGLVLALSLVSIFLSSSTLISKVENRQPSTMDVLAHGVGVQAHLPVQPSVKKKKKHFFKKVFKKQKHKENRPTHWANIAGFATGLLGFLLIFTAPSLILGSFLLGVLGIIFGGIGMGKSGSSKEYSGQGMGIAGLICGILTIVIFFIAVIVVASILI